MKLHRIPMTIRARRLALRMRSLFTPAAVYAWVLSALMVASSASRADDLDIYTRSIDISGNAPLVAMVADTSADMACSLLSASCSGPATTLLNERSYGMKDALRAVITSGDAALRVAIVDYADVPDAGNDGGRVIHEAKQVGGVVSSTTTAVPTFTGLFDERISAGDNDASQAYNPNTGLIGPQIDSEGTITAPVPPAPPVNIGDIVTGSWAWSSGAGLNGIPKDGIEDSIQYDDYWLHPEWYGNSSFYYEQESGTTQTFNLDLTSGNANPVLFLVDYYGLATPLVLSKNDDRSSSLVCPEGYSEVTSGANIGKCKKGGSILPKVLTVITNSTVSATGLVAGRFYKLVAATWASGETGSFSLSIANGGTGSFYSTDEATPEQYQFGGFYFDNIDIPYGAEIESAKLVFTRSDDLSGAVEISTFYDCNSDVQDLATTTIWNRWWCGGQGDKFESGEATPEIDYKDEIQAKVSSYGWCPGSAMMMFFYAWPGQGSNASLYTYDGDPSKAPRLVIEYKEDTGDPLACVSTRHEVMKVSAMSEDTNQFADGTMDLSKAYMPSSAQATCPAGSTDVGCRRTRLNLDENSKVGLRFTLAPIQPGATVVSAKLRLTAKNTATPQPLEIRGILNSGSGNATAFYADTNHLDSLDLTGPTAWTWLPTDSWQEGVVYESPDIASLVQQQVDQVAWTSQNTLGFVLNGTEATTMEACAWESGPGGGTTGVDPSTFGSCAAELVLEIDDNELPVETTYRSTMVTALMGMKKSGRQPMGGGYLKASQYLAGYFNDITSDTIVDAGTLDSAPVKPPLAEGDCASNNIVFISDVNEGARYPAGFDANFENFSTAAGNPIGNCNVSGSAANQSSLGCNTALAAMMYEGFTGIGNTDTSKITTYTFNFNATAGGAGVDEGAVDLGTSDAGGGNLRMIAESGGGAFKQAGSSAQLVKQLLTVLRSIADAGASVAAPGISVNALNRFEHLDQLYYSLFKPSTKVDWTGNLKRYQLKDSNVADIEGDVAVSTSTNGFFDPLSQSFWSALPDGSTVVVGGAAQKTRASERRIFTYLGDNASATEVTLTEEIKIDGALTENDVGIDILPNYADLTQLQIDALRNQVIEFLRATPRENTTVLWPASIHNSPRIVSFKNSTDPVVTVFYGDNRGFIHAIDAGGLTKDSGADNFAMADETVPAGATAGKELFAFLPQELLKNAATFHANTQSVLTDGYIYGMDGDITLYRVDENRDGNVERVLLFSGMRRGGDNYYALDVSNARRDVEAAQRTPILQWVIEGGSTGYEEMGQTWSAMSPNRIFMADPATGVATRTNVLVFGGGYDSSRHDDGEYGIDTADLNATPYSFVAPGTPEKGAAVFITNPEDGKLIWKSTMITGATLDLPQYVALKSMNYSIVATPRLIDRNGDGAYDAIYVVDLAGQVFRLELNKSASLNADGTSDDLVSKVVLVAALGATGEAMPAVGSGAEAVAGSTAHSVLDNRRFYDSPSVAYIGSDVLLALSSGYREEPTSGTSVETFFFLKDKGAFSALAPVNATIKVSQLDNISTNAVDDPAVMTKPGWYYQFDKSKGEKGIGSPIIFNTAILWSTYIVEQSLDPCIPDIGSTRLYFVDFLGRGQTTLTEGDATPSRYRDIELPGLADTPQIIFREGGGIDVAVGVRVNAGEKLCIPGVNCPLDTNAFGKLRRSRWYMVDDD